MPPVDPDAPDAERALIARVVAIRSGAAADDSGDLARLEALLATHRSAVHARCTRVLGDDQRAQEVTHEALLIAWQRLPTFDGRSSFATWVHGIAHNLCKNALRKHGEALVDDDHLFELDVADPAPGAATLLRRSERRVLVLEASRALDPLEQEAVYLRYVEDLPYDRIAAILELENESGARGLLQRCRRRLAKAMQAALDARGVGLSFVRSTP